LAWFPRLRDAPRATDEQALIGRGEGIYWPDLDDDISILGLIAGYGDATRSRRKAAAE